MLKGLGVGASWPKYRRVHVNLFQAHAPSPFYKKFWSPIKLLVPKKCWSPKNVGPNKLNFVPKKFWSKKILVQKNILVLKNVGPKKFWSKKILAKKNFGPKKFGPNKFWSKQILVQTNFGPKKIWSKKFWSQKFFKFIFFQI